MGVEVTNQQDVHYHWPDFFKHDFGKNSKHTGRHHK